ncbi:MAG: FMN-binding domain protein [Clostridiaceae bacterium]|jgi:polyferredoxin|nr:FMN-binding domain protein [Clostridiaceae bacterium]
MFFLLPGLYIMTFNELKSIYEMIIKGSFSFIQVLPNSVELISLISITIILGRFFYGYLCPLGALFNIFSKLSIFKINMPKDKCENCRACTSQCSMGISLFL